MYIFNDLIGNNVNSIKLYFGSFRTREVLLSRDLKSKNCGMYFFLLKDSVWFSERWRHVHGFYSNWKTLISCALGRNLYVLSFYLGLFCKLHRSRWRAWRSAQISQCIDALPPSARCVTHGLKLCGGYCETDFPVSLAAGMADKTPKEGSAPFATRIDPTKEGLSQDQLHYIRQVELEQWKKKTQKLRTRNVATGLAIGALVLGICILAMYANINTRWTM